MPDALEEALAGVSDEERPLVLFDTYERMQAIDGYLRRSLLPSLPGRLRSSPGARPPAPAGSPPGGRTSRPSSSSTG